MDFEFKANSNGIVILVEQSDMRGHCCVLQMAKMQFCQRKTKFYSYKEHLSKIKYTEKALIYKTCAELFLVDEPNHLSIVPAFIGKNDMNGKTNT